MTSTPTLSVLIASAAGEDFLFRCLDDLREQVSEAACEVVVVDRIGGEHAARIRREYPWVDLLSLESDVSRPSVPELRAAGMARASGDVVAVVEEHCAPAPNWLATIRRSWQPGDVAIGGPVFDSSYRHPRDWAIYFSEFHNYMPPWSEGERFALNGVNIAYDRSRVLAERDVLADGYWEVVLHPRLVKHGRFRAVPEMRVHHAGPFDFALYLEQRYLLSRVWGGASRATTSLLKRVAYLVLAPLFPLLLLARIAVRVLAAPRFLGRFVIALPWLVPITIAYVCGEWMGYAFGLGDALERVE